MPELYRYVKFTCILCQLFSFIITLSLLVNNYLVNQAYTRLFQRLLNLLQNITHPVVELQKTGTLPGNVGMSGRCYLLKQLAHFHSPVLGVPDIKRNLLTRQQLAPPVLEKAGNQDFQSPILLFINILVVTTQ